MSNALAIATVSYMLKDLLTETIGREQSVVDAAGGQIVYSTLPPSRIEVGSKEKPQLNLFLYHLVPNPAWRNVGLPSRDSRGARETNPPLALDLHYLLTAYGNKDLHAEILLGYAMQALHEAPVLTRSRIMDRLDRIAGEPTEMPRTALTKSDLAEQVEQVKIAPHALGAEELSKLWSAFQAEFRPSTAYHVSVVLIDRKEPARATLPVLTIGGLINNRERGVVAHAGLLPPVPTLAKVVPPNKQAAIRLGEPLVLHGHHLGRADLGDSVKVRLTHARTQWEKTLDVLPVDSKADEIGVTILDVPAEFRAGIYAVAAIVRPASASEDRISNELPLALAPAITLPPPTTAGGVRTFVVNVTPNVHRGQRVSLLVGTQELAHDLIDAAVAQLTFTCKTEKVPPGEYVVRLRVDGVESLVIAQPDEQHPIPQFDPQSKVTVA